MLYWVGVYAIVAAVALLPVLAVYIFATMVWFTIRGIVTAARGLKNALTGAKRSESWVRLHLHRLFLPISLKFR